MARVGAVELGQHGITVNAICPGFTETELLFTSYLLVTGAMMFFTSWVSSRIGARSTLLIGLGLRQLSMPPHQLPEIKRVVRAVNLDHARTLAAEALRFDTAELVARKLRDDLRLAIPEETLGTADASPSPEPEAG